MDHTKSKETVKAPKPATALRNRRLLRSGVCAFLHLARGPARTLSDPRRALLPFRTEQGGPERQESRAGYEVSSKPMWRAAASVVS